MIPHFCRKRVTQVLPSKETEQREQYLVALRRADGSVPALGRGVNWRRISEPADLVGDAHGVAVRFTLHAGEEAGMHEHAPVCRPSGKGGCGR